MDSQITIKTKNGDFKLVRQDLIEGKASMRLPETFKDLPKKSLVNSEVNDQKIDISKVNEIKTAAFSMARRTLDDKSVEVSEKKYIAGSIAGFRKVFSRIAPGYQEIGVFSKEISNHVVGCINYLSHGMESDLFQILVLFMCDHELCQCNFTCKDKDAAEWNLIFMTCIESLEITD